MTILSIWTVLDTIRDKVTDSQLGTIGNIAGIIACVMAGVAIISLTREYIRGADLDPWDLLRPIIIMLLTCNFGTIILGPVDSVTNVVTGKLAEATTVRNVDYISKWGDNISKIAANSVILSVDEYQKELEEISKDDSRIGRFFSKMWLTCRKMFKSFFGIQSMTVAGIIGSVLFLLAKILIFVQQLLCAVYLLINSLIGPLVMALCIIPGFEGGFKHWLARYIQIAMWVPIGYIIMGVNLWITEACTDLALMKDIGLGIEWLMICLQVVALVGIAAVPKIAAWVIESSGANDAHGSMSNPARMVARKLLKM